MSAVFLDQGILTIAGDKLTANHLEVRLSDNGETIWGIANNQAPEPFAISQVAGIRITGGQRADAITVDARLRLPAHVEGGAGNDTILGGRGNDMLLGQDGDDVIDGRAGDDYIAGDSGRDSLRGGGGHDLIRGGQDNDTIRGGAGNDSLTGGGDDDTLNGVRGNDTVYGGVSGDDYVDGDTGINDVDGGVGGHDTVISSTGPDPSDASDPITPTDDTTPTDTITPADPTGDGTPADATAPQPVIRLLQPSVTAGNAIHVQALESLLGAGTSLTAQYQWDFGDAGSRYDQLSGFNAAHVYDSPGTYTVTLHLTNETGKQAISSVQVTVLPDARPTIYVDAQGDDANDGLNPWQPVRSADRAMQLLGDDTRLMFHRGDSFAVTHGLTISNSNVLIGSYGDSAAPAKLVYAGGVVSGTAILSLSGARDVTIQDLSLDSAGSTYTTAANGIYLGGTNLTVRRVQFLNLSDALNLNRDPVGVLVQDNTAPLADVWRNGGQGVHNYFAWVQGTDLVFLNNTVANSGAHGLRAAKGYDRLLLAGNDLTNTAGMTSLKLHDGRNVYVTNNHLTSWLDVEIGPLGGKDGIACNPTDYTTQRTQWVVFDANTVSGDAAIDVHHRSEHVMLRNNVLKRDGKPLINIDGYDQTFQAGVVDVTIAHNTGINNGDKGNFLYVLGDSQPNHSAQITLVNNLYVAPRLMTGAYQTAVVYVAAWDLDSFREVRGNVWPAAATNAYAHGGYFYVWPSWSNIQGYKTAGTWSTYDVVSGEKYQNVLLDGQYRPVAGTASSMTVQPVAGVFADLLGQERTGPVSAGAVQLN